MQMKRHDVRNAAAGKERGDRVNCVSAADVKRLIAIETLRSDSVNGSCRVAARVSESSGLLPAMRDNPIRFGAIKNAR